MQYGSYCIAALHALGLLHMATTAISSITGSYGWSAGCRSSHMPTGPGVLAVHCTHCTVHIAVALCMSLVNQLFSR